MIYGQRMSYWLAYAGMHLLALLPFRALYALSDCLYVLLRYVVGYRKKVVRTNLRNSFPEKSKHELREIERKFYHYICDVSLKIAAKVSNTGTIFGSVGAMQVADELAKLGIEIDRKIITVKGAVKEVGNYVANVQLHKEVKVEIPFEVVAEAEEA